MSAPITIAEKARVDTPALVCRIRHRLRPKRGYSPIATLRYIQTHHNDLDKLQAGYVEYVPCCAMASGLESDRGEQMDKTTPGGRTAGDLQDRRLNALCDQSLVPLPFQHCVGWLLLRETASPDMEGRGEWSDRWARVSCQYSDPAVWKYCLLQYSA